MQAFETNRRFYQSFGELSVKEDLGLLDHAASLVAARELEQQAGTNEDGARQPVIDRMRLNLADAQEALVGNPRWLDSGKRSTSSGQLLAFQACLVVGVFGGLVLLVPMMIMVLHPTKLTALVTTIVCVLFVTVALSVAVDDAQPKDIFAATAAYAAVLVVFVGTSTTSSSGESDRVVGAIAGGVLGGILLLMGLWFGPFHLLFLRRERRRGITFKNQIYKAQCRVPEHESGSGRRANSTAWD